MPCDLGLGRVDDAAFGLGGSHHRADGGVDGVEPLEGRGGPPSAQGVRSSRVDVRTMEGSRAPSGQVRGVTYLRVQQQLWWISDEHSRLMGDAVQYAPQEGRCWLIWLSPTVR